jgi:hypothetical protein
MRRPFTLSTSSVIVVVMACPFFRSDRRPMSEH